MSRNCYSTVMMTDSVQYAISGHDAASVTRSFERGVRTGALRPGDTVPSVRALARELSLSPSTVAAAYRDLRQRNVLVSHDRSRTVVAHRPPLPVRLGAQLPAGAVDLATGNPDPTLLPTIGSFDAVIDHKRRLYGTEVTDEALAGLARDACEADGVAADHLTVVGGGLDGIERALEVHCRAGDRVAVEDPGYAGTFDLIRALGLIPLPVEIDNEGMLPDALDEALDDSVQALIHVPRAQNPYGSVTSSARAAVLRERLADHPEVLVVEDDHAAALAEAPLASLTTDREQWAVVRSLAKTLGPDLRVAIMVGDEDTLMRVQGRQRLGTGWVSHVLQQTAAGTWQAANADGTFEHAATTYTARREALLTALQAQELVGHGVSGLNVWIPVAEEVPVVQGMLANGWAVQAGEPYRINADPGIRVTTAALPIERAEAFVRDLTDVLGQRLDTRRG